MKIVTRIEFVLTLKYIVLKFVHRRRSIAWAVLRIRICLFLTVRIRVRLFIF